MKNPTVSAIITTKNEEENIERLLESIRRQGYKDVEIIVVDNDSSDKTKEIAKAFTNKVYNRGPERSAQRNYGAAKSKGQFLLFLDADMELSADVIKNCVAISQKSGIKLLVIPETTVGDEFLARIRRFEREMYLNEPDYEVPRFFERNTFFEYGGYDERLTGPEDYDLAYRIGQKNKTERVGEYIYHHEGGLTLGRLLYKKYYYARKGAFYAVKHPRLVRIQGTILFRRVYLKHWRNFLKHPVLGISFLAVRFLETVWAVGGFISATRLKGFGKTFFKIFLKQ